jgi:hypothetical protein
MRDEKLGEILKKKEFKNFWYCFEYLLLAGYPDNEAIGHSLNEFKESSIFSDVAFIAMHKYQKDVMFTLDEVNTIYRPSILKVGLFDETNRVLEPMMSTYRQWLAANNKNKWQSQLEAPFASVKYVNLSSKTLGYLLEVAKKHYGFEPFVIIPPEKSVTSMPLIIQDGLPSIEELRRRMYEIVGIPANRLGENTNTRII